MAEKEPPNNDLNDPPKLQPNDGQGSYNARGPVVNYFSPGPGDGENARNAARPEGIPSNYGYAVPPIGWKDSGVPGLFIDDQGPYYKLDKQILNYAEIRVDVVFPMLEGHIPERVSVTESVRFLQRLLFDNVKVTGPHLLCLDTLKSVKMLFLSCIAGTGTMALNDGAPLAMAGRRLDLTYDLPNTRHSTYIYFNWLGGVTKVLLDGNMTVYAAAFE